MTPAQCGWICVVACLAITGCGSTDPELKVFPVYGRVIVDGLPPVRAELRFKPKTPLRDPLKRSIEPHAIVMEDGRFEVGTYLNDDGAPPGEYAVTLVWPKVTIEGGEEVFGPDRLHGRFADPLKPIATITVDDDEVNFPPIELRTN